MTTLQESTNLFDVIGVGIGPSNLSAAALIHPITDLRARFFERKPDFQWHPGMLLPEAFIQVSFLKDLVTLVDPTSRFSFLSFLAVHGRMYRFINARFPAVSRQEFNQYLRWVCSLLPNLEFNRAIESIDLHDNLFAVSLGDRRVYARNVILGTGLVPKVPRCAKFQLGPTLFHAADYMHRRFNPAGKRIAVIGGGQSGAEIVDHLLQDSHALPARVYWISRRSNFLPLDDSPFINDLFTPDYSNFFFQQPEEQRLRLLEEQKFASDGISMSLLEKIYRRCYTLEFLEGCGQPCAFYAHTELLNLHPAAGGWKVCVQSTLTDTEAVLEADIVILCTGFDYQMPPCLEPIAGRLQWGEQGFSTRADFSINWDGPEHLKIYAQNASKLMRGVADPNLSLMAWRSAVIINSITGCPIYNLSGPDYAQLVPAELVIDRL